MVFYMGVVLYMENDGIPFDPKSDLFDVCQRYCQVKGVALEPSHVKRIRWSHSPLTTKDKVPNKKGKDTVQKHKKPPVLHITFQNSKIKQHIKTSEKKIINLNEMGIHETGDPQIYFSDFLTKKQEHLFYLARSKKKEKKWKHCWCTNGKVFMRKDENEEAVFIKSENDLLKIE
eukprot:Lithocolla_globosa_v1_NODE_468_length_3964_cov_97.214377.p2 type:complete len:174 gc:universal NODE_468_length_3964_cov_97.214377:166-687(+)